MKSSRMIISRWLLLTLFCVSSAFGAADIKSDYDRGYSLDRLRSFKFVAQANGSSADVLVVDELATKRIQNAIERNLVSAGYVKEQSADFAISYRAVLRTQAQVTTSGFPRFGAGRVWVDNYTVGTVIVEFRDAKSGDLVWRGAASGTVDSNKNEEKINDGIKKLIERFQKDRERQKKASR